MEDYELNLFFDEEEVATKPTESQEGVKGANTQQEKSTATLLNLSRGQTDDLSGDFDLFFDEPKGKEVEGKEAAGAGGGRGEGGETWEKAPSTSQEAMKESIKVPTLPAKRRKSPPPAISIPSSSRSDTLHSTPVLSLTAVQPSKKPSSIISEEEDPEADFTYLYGEMAAAEEARLGEDEGSPSVIGDSEGEYRGAEDVGGYLEVLAHERINGQIRSRLGDVVSDEPKSGCEAIEGWTPPADAAPNRQYSAAPNLTLDENGDIPVRPAPSTAFTYASFVEPNLAIRFSKDTPSVSTTGGLKANSLFVIRYLEFAVEEKIPPEKRFPVDPKHVIAWAAVLSYRYSGAYLKRHINALVFWSQLHFLQLDFDHAAVNKIAKAADLRSNKTPLPERRPPQPRSPLATRDARLKDVVVQRQYDQRPSKKPKLGEKAEPKKAFDKKYDVAGGAIKFLRPNGSDKDSPPPLAVIHIPFCKRNLEKGCNFFLLEQKNLGPYGDPVFWQCAHIRSNVPTENDPLYSYIGRDGKTRVKLTRAALMREVNKALKSTGRKPLKGHTFRNGGLNFYKMAGTDTSINQKQGGWASSSFQRYHRRLEQTAINFTANLEDPRDNSDLVSDGELEADEREEVDDRVPENGKDNDFVLA
ncbi:hypothetical protein JCM8547_007404 [Rhodosporidiobolus lusitaniae]